MKYIITVIAFSVLIGCATRHARIAAPVQSCNAQLTNKPCLSPPHQLCDINGANCETVQDWNPSQLTPVGCLTHALVTFGHVAQECRKNASHGRWIWQ